MCNYLARGRSGPGPHMLTPAREYRRTSRLPHVAAIPYREWSAPARECPGCQWGTALAPANDLRHLGTGVYTDLDGDLVHYGPCSPEKMCHP